jgi:hypothetical protein
MERTCCGKPCETPYCPHCGRAVRPAHPLEGLLSHCRRTAGMCRRKAEEYRREQVDPEVDQRRRSALERWAGMKDALAAKWQAWHDALAALISGKDGPHGQ